jgi:GntR family transcriptional regulator/MocR family aminotransferase
VVREDDVAGCQWRRVRQLHLVAWLPEDLNEATVIAAAAQEGVAVAGASPYRLSPAPRGGLIFGYSNLNERQIGEGVTGLARAISRLRNGTATSAAAID